MRGPVESEQCTGDDNAYTSGACPGSYESPNGSAGKLHLAWTVPFAPGKQVAVAKDAAGKVVARDEVDTAGAPDALKLTPDKTVLRADGKSLSYVTVHVVDAHGVEVPDADNPIDISVRRRRHASPAPTTASRMTPRATSRPHTTHSTASYWRSSRPAPSRDRSGSWHPPTGFTARGDDAARQRPAQRARPTCPLGPAASQPPRALAPRRVNRPDCGRELFRRRVLRRRLGLRDELDASGGDARRQPRDVLVKPLQQGRDPDAPADHQLAPERLGECQLGGTATGRPDPGAVPRRRQRPVAGDDHGLCTGMAARGDP